MNPQRIKIEPFTVHGHRFENYIDTLTGQKYRRIYGGLAWPRGTVPGFAVLVGETHKESGQTRMYTLAEAEIDFSGLVNWCLGFSGFCRWYGNTLDKGMVGSLHTFNREQQQRSRLYLREAALVAEDLRSCFQYGINRILERTSVSRKTLFLEETPRLKAVLESAPVDFATGQNVEDCPPLAALCFAVGTMDNFGFADPEQMAGTERSGDYDPLRWGL